jgi:hypothetical protein
LKLVIELRGVRGRPEPLVVPKVTRADVLGQVDEPPVRQRRSLRLQVLLGQDTAAGEQSPRAGTQYDAFSEVER